MDEGGFVVDYIMPAGSSLAETNRVVGHVEQMLREVPEVESTSRRTGLQLGLAAVTEANTGDILVKLKDKRNRGIDEIIADVRADIKNAEPALDVEFIQVLQDMIGDLTSAPEPIQIKLFSQDPKQLEEWAPKVADAISKIKGVVDVLDGIDNTISGPAVTFQVDPSVAARAGFSVEEVALDASAILEGEPAPTPVVTNDRAYTSAGTLSRSEPGIARGDARHAASQRYWSHGNAGHAGHDGRESRTDRNSSRKSATRCCGDSAPGRKEPGQRNVRRTKSYRRT